MQAAAQTIAPSVTIDDVPALLDDWAHDVIASNDGGLGYSPRSAVVGFTDPPTGQRPGSTIPRGAVDGYGTTERQLIVATDNAVACLPPRAKKQIELRYLAKPRLNREDEAKLFKVDKRTLCRWWRDIREDLQIRITAHLIRNG